MGEHSQQQVDKYEVLLNRSHLGSRCFGSNVCCSPRGVATFERTVAGDLRSHGPTMMATVAASPGRDMGGGRRGFVDDEAQSKRCVLTLKYPIEHGTVTNWDDMEYASGRTTDSHTVPIFEGHAHHAVLRLAGRDPAEYLMKNLTEQGCSFTATAEKEIAREVNEKLRNIGVDCDTELKSTAESTRRKPMSYLTETLSLSKINISIFAGLLSAKFHREREESHDTSFRCFIKSDADFRKELHANVVSSGGTTVFQGTVERVTKELTALAPSTMNFQGICSTRVSRYPKCPLGVDL